MSIDFDVLVIGGGIIGASAAHHMASSGYTTLLVEQADYASGTTSRTSRMHNCGFMYFVDAHASLTSMLRHPIALLKSLELARRTMRERAAFVTSSPDRVRKVDFVIPFEAQKGITRFKMRAASWLLKLLGGSSVSLEPRFFTAAQARNNPILKLMQGSSVFDGAFGFAEYQYNWPERIVIDTILKGRAVGLDARNYTKVVGLRQVGGMWTATLESGGERSVVTAKAVVNAAGAWVDHVTGLARERFPALNTGAKGVNLLVRLPPEARGLGMETVTNSGGPFYVMPWGDFHYMGPADSPADADHTEFRATPEEIDQILNDANDLFPRMDISRSDVLYSWAGVRPRTASPGMPLGSLEVREHDLTAAGLANFFVFTGGLIMTHRDAGRRLLKLVRRAVRPSRQPKAIDYNLTSKPDEDSVTCESVTRAIMEEQARSLVDILRRRLSVGWNGDLGRGEVDSAAAYAAEVLGWNDAELRRQVEEYHAHVDWYYGAGTRESNVDPHRRGLSVVK